MLVDGAKSGERAVKGKPAADSKSATLKDLGVSESQSVRWQNLAGITEAKFEQAVTRLDNVLNSAIATSTQRRLSALVRSRQFPMPSSPGGPLLRARPGAGARTAAARPTRPERSWAVLRHRFSKIFRVRLSWSDVPII